LFDTAFRAALKDNRKKPEGFELSEHQMVPNKGVLHDWVFTDSGGWVQWEDTLETRGSTSGKAALVMTPETTCMQYFLKTCLDCHLPILFVGPTGTGKSAVTLDHLLSLPAEECTSNIVNFSARTSAALTLDLVMDKLTKCVRIRIKYFFYNFVCYASPGIPRKYLDLNLAKSALFSLMI
jgi:dynein heavy chain, axonemal